VSRYAFVTRLREWAAAEPDRPKRQTVTLPDARHAVCQDSEVYVALLLRAKSSSAPSAAGPWAAKRTGAAGGPGGAAPLVAVLLEVVDREVLALRRVRKASIAELLDDGH
jgi:hypothetical protein